MLLKESTATQGFAACQNNGQLLVIASGFAGQFTGVL
jgi:hypothetical protein